MENHTQADSEGEVFFRRPNPDTAGQYGLSRCDSLQTLADDDVASVTEEPCREQDLSPSRVSLQDVAANTSPVNAGLPDCGRSDSVLNEISGVLKDVVAELKSLKQSVPQRAEQCDPSTSNHRAQFGMDAGHGDFAAQPGHHRYQGADTGHNQRHQYEAVRPRLQGHDLNFNSVERQMDVNFDRRVGQDIRFRDGRRLAPRVRMAEGVKIPAFTGKEDWQVWIKRFEAIAERYGWDDEDKLDQLLPRMEGQAAQFLYGQLPKHILGNYGELVTEMYNRFRVVETSRSFAAKFSRRNQRAGETAEDYAADLKMLYDKAHGYRDRRTREEDLVRKFLDGLRDEELRFEVEFHKEPETIDEAVYHVVNFIQTRNSGGQDKRYRAKRRAVHAEGFSDDDVTGETLLRVPDRAITENRAPREADTRSAEGGQNQQMQNRQEEMFAKILQRLDKLEGTDRPAAPRPRKEQAQRSLDTVECFYCHVMGHYARDCPQKRSRANEGVAQGQRLGERKGARVVGNTVDLNSKGPAPVARRRSD